MSDLTSHIQRYKLLIEYAGTRYYGWQKQKHHPNTIQEKVETAIYQFSRQAVEVFGSGRTDTGVHALGQVAHFDLDLSKKTYTTEKIQAAINAHLIDEQIAILKVEEAKPDFHARFDAVQRRYEYHILNRKAPPTYNKDIITHIPYPLLLNPMQEAAKLLIGTHDLSSFRAADCQANSPVKTIDEICISQKGAQITIFVAAKSFLYNQIRNMAGTLIKIGAGKWPVEKMQTILEAKDRCVAGPTAPPNGLFFLEARYEA